MTLQVRESREGQAGISTHRKMWENETLLYFGQRVKHFNRLEQAVRSVRKANKGKVTVGGKHRLEALLRRAAVSPKAAGSPWRAPKQGGTMLTLQSHD